MCPTCVLVAAVSAAALSRAPFETRVCARAPSSQSRQIGFDELYEFVRGKRHALDPRHKKRVADLRMLPPPGAECTLEEIAWSVDVLRPMLLSSMQRGYIGSGDLISAWDKNGDGDLSEFEFVGKMRTLFAGHDRLWKVRRTVSGIEPLRSAAGRVRLGDAAGWVRSGDAAGWVRCGSVLGWRLPSGAYATAHTGLPSYGIPLALAAGLPSVAGLRLSTGFCHWRAGGVIRHQIPISRRVGRLIALLIAAGLRC